MKKTIFDVLKKSLMISVVLSLIGSLLYIGWALMVSNFSALLEWQVYIGVLIFNFAMSLLYFVLDKITDET